MKEVKQNRLKCEFWQCIVAFYFRMKNSFGPSIEDILASFYSNGDRDAEQSNGTTSSQGKERKSNIKVEDPSFLLKVISPRRGIPKNSHPFYKLIHPLG